MGFTPLDYVIVAVYLIGTTLFGSLVGRGQKSTRDYFLGGGKMSWWAISFSIVATETSTLTFIGAPAIAYTGNMTLLQLTFGYLLGKVLVTLILIPGYFRGEIQTAYELLKQQFGSKVRNFSAVLFQLTRVLADGVRLYATALVLSVVTGIPVGWTVLIIGAATIAYTFFGGMKAVVWNDVIQLLVYISGAFLALYFILEGVPGGWPEITSAAATAGKFEWLNPSWALSEPYTLISGLIGGAFLTFSTHGTDQMMVQRYLACGDRRQSQVALMVSGVVVILQFLLFLVIGVMLYAFYQHFPMAQPLEEADRVFPLFIVTQMPPGVSGLVIAAIFAAAMSTLSSSLNSLSSSSMNDFYRAKLRPGAEEGHYLRVSRGLTLAWGIAMIGVSILARSWGGVLEAGLTIQSLTMGSVLGIFLLGTATRRISETGGLIGMVAGLIAMLAVASNESIAWTWYSLIGSGVTVIVGLVADRLLGRRPYRS